MKGDFWIEEKGRINLTIIAENKAEKYILQQFAKQKGHVETLSFGDTEACEYSWSGWGYTRKVRFSC